jgi:hypothetical protein
MPQQWTLPGPTAPYLVVWSYDAAAQDGGRRVPVFTLFVLLKSWVHSRRNVIRQIYDALEHTESLRLSGLRGIPSDEQLRERLAEAFRSNRLIVLTLEEDAASVKPSATTPKSALKKQGGMGNQGVGADRVPFRVLREDEASAATTSLGKKGAQVSGAAGQGPFPSVPATGNEKTFRLGIVVRDKAPPLQFRSSPMSTGDNVIGSLAFNTPVQIMEQLPGGWLHVGTLTQGSGYVAASYVWSAPEHPVLDAAVRLHRVEKYESATGKGTAIAIAKAHYGVKSGQGLPFYVALLALVNGVPIPRTVEGWKELRFQADRFIWVPSQEFADSMRGKLTSGSYTYELLDRVGLAELVDKIQDVLARVARFLTNLAEAIRLSGPYILEAIAKHVEEALITILQSLLLMAAFAVLFLGACTAIGAWLGAGGPGAAAGFKIGMALLEWMGLGFLVQWAVDSIKRIGSAFVTFLVSVWNADQDQNKLDHAARELAEVLGILAGVLVELLVMWAATNGVSAALKSLKGSYLEGAFGEGRLNSWLREAVRVYNKAKPEIKIKDRQIFKTKVKAQVVRVKTPAQTLNWLQASQLARDLGIPEGQKQTLLKAPNPREAVIRAWTRKLAQELQITEASADALLQSRNPREAIFQHRARNLAKDLGIKEAEAERLLRVTERALRNEQGKRKNPSNALRRALGSKAEWERFSPELEAAFKKRLLDFRQKLDLSMDTKFSGQEGQIFESEVEAGVCLKRWFKKALDKMPESIRLLEEAHAEIQSDPKLRDLIEIVRIHERGEDWILRDFEFDSIPLSKALGDPKVSSVRASLFKELQARQRVEGTLSKALGDLLKKLGEPPSANVHWSPTKKKCVVIDMQ